MQPCGAYDFGQNETAWFLESFSTATCICLSRHVQNTLYRTRPDHASCMRMCQRPGSMHLWHQLRSEGEVVFDSASQTMLMYINFLETYGA